MIAFVAVVAAPLIFRLYSISVSDEVDADLFRSAGTTLARIFLVQILFYGLTGVGNAFLQSRRRFFVAAWSPILPNLVIIATLLALPGAGDTDGDSRTCSTTSACGGRSAWAPPSASSMAMVTLPAMFAAGLRYRPVLEWKHPAVRKLLVLSGWTIGFVAANQIAVVVIRNLATHEERASCPPTSMPSRGSCCRTASWRCRSPRRSSPSWRGPCSTATARSSCGACRRGHG